MLCSDTCSRCIRLLRSCLMRLSDEQQNVANFGLVDRQMLIVCHTEIDQPARNRMHTCYSITVDCSRTWLNFSLCDYFSVEVYHTALMMECASHSNSKSEKISAGKNRLSVVKNRPTFVVHLSAPLVLSFSIVVRQLMFGVSIQLYSSVLT